MSNTTPTSHRPHRDDPPWRQTLIAIMEARKPFQSPAMDALLLAYARTEGHTDEPDLDQDEETLSRDLAQRLDAMPLLHLRRGIGLMGAWEDEARTALAERKERELGELTRKEVRPKHKEADMAASLNPLSTPNAELREEARARVRDTIQALIRCEDIHISPGDLTVRMADLAVRLDMLSDDDLFVAHEEFPIATLRRLAALRVERERTLAARRATETTATHARKPDEVQALNPELDRIFEDERLEDEARERMELDAQQVGRRR